MDKALTVCVLRMSCASAVPTLHGPPWAGSFPPSAHPPWRHPWALHISSAQLRRQWRHLPLTTPRMSWSFVEIKARRGFAGTLWLKSTDNCCRGKNSWLLCWGAQMMLKSPSERSRCSCPG